jgi:hypothetical protein
VQRLARFSYLNNTDSQAEQLSDRVENIIRFFERQPRTVQTALNDIAMVSITDCHDGDLSGFLEIEKYMDNMRLAAEAKRQRLSAKQLYQAALGHYGCQCIAESALELASALGSTREAVEIELLLISHLSERLQLPVHLPTMQNPDYALSQFNSAMNRKYGQARISALFPQRMDFLAQELLEKRSDKQSVISFMANWGPARAYVDHQCIADQKARGDENLAATFDHLERVIVLAQKTELNSEDRESLSAIVAFLAVHRTAIPESLVLEIEGLVGAQSTTPVLTDECVRMFASALSAVRYNIGQSPYRTALAKLYLD